MICAFASFRPRRVFTDVVLQKVAELRVRRWIRKNRRPRENNTEWDIVFFNEAHPSGSKTIQVDGQKNAQASDNVSCLIEIHLGHRILRVWERGPDAWTALRKSLFFLSHAGEAA